MDQERKASQTGGKKHCKKKQPGLFGDLEAICFWWSLVSEKETRLWKDSFDVEDFGLCCSQYGAIKQFQVKEN